MSTGMTITLAPRGVQSDVLMVMECDRCGYRWRGEADQKFTLDELIDVMTLHRARTHDAVTTR